MKNTITIITTVSILVIAFSNVFAAYTQAGQNENTIETEQEIPITTQNDDKQRQRVDFVKSADFYLRNGKLITGKLLSEDKNKITVEQLEGSAIVVSTYSKREVDSRTLRIRKTPKYKYYLELAEYFTGRTWDFRDDADDFIQAIRCYEKARRSVVETQGPDDEKIEQIDQSLEHLRADREVWIQEVESRAVLKKLEFEAEIESRIEELEDKFNASIEQINESMERFSKISAAIEDDYQKILEEISKIDESMAFQLKILEERIEENRRLINRRLRRHPWLYYPHSRRHSPAE
ncbi:MAG: hypothetical protein JSV82_02645 [Planctomycetota bacterium]|nr:MAG: hypothetical protein JSV82_02645 [Planctomycetota bacterium]